MSDTSGAAMGLSRLLLWVLIVLNLAAGALMLTGFVASFIFEAPLSRALHAWLERADLRLLLPTVRIWLLLAMPAVAAMHLLLLRTLAILQTVRLGHPFEAENAQRLRTMAWCMLAVQVVHLTGGVMARIATAAAHERIDWDFSIIGWLAVFLLFVLARVFEEGARLRTDLEAMI